MRMILATGNPVIIESIKDIFKKHEGEDFWETIPQHQRDDILHGIQEIENEDVVDYEEFIRKHR